MTRIIGDVAAVDRVPTEGTVIVQSVEMRPGATLVVTGEPQPYPITAGRFVVEDAEPGPTRFIIQGGGAHHEVRVTVPDRPEVTFLELLESVFEWEPTFIAQGAEILNAAREAASRAEAASDRLGSAEQIIGWTNSADFSAKAAANSASAAKSSESAAKNSETAAASSASASSSSATAAKTSETNAGTSKSAAASSATAAAGSATAASTSATAADGSKSAAASSALAAKNSETAAGNSATAAADARDSAQAYAGAAQTQAQAAQTSAGTATSKAGEASLSAAAAKDSEGKAKASETAAASSASTASQASMVAQDAAVVATAAAQSVTTYSGKGSPEGKVTAGVGALYVDSVATCGAVTWRKMSGTGNTGWRVENGDTGWRNVTSLLSPAPTSGALKVRRWNDTLWIQASWLLARRGTYSLTLPPEWGPPVNSGGNLSNSIGAITADCRFVYTGELTIKKNDDGSVDSVARFIPKDAVWPATLPGTPA